MLTDDELDNMRGAVIDALPVTGAIVRATPTADGLGGTSLVWAAVRSSVPMRLAPFDGAAFADVEFQGRASNSKRWNLTLPAGTDVRSDDRVSIDGRTFEVDSVAAPRTWELAVRVVVNEVL